MENKRLIGIKVCGITALLFSLFFLFVCFPLAGFPKIDWEVTGINLIIAMSFGISGIFLIRLKNWARILFLLQMACWAILVFMAVRSFHTRGVSSKIKETIEINSKIWLWWFALGFLPAFLSGYFLTRPKVREEFK